MSRIELTDTGLEAIIKMADGNPGAVMAMNTILENHGAIDPQSMLGGIGAIMMLDTWGIYGSDIHSLLKTKCGGDVRKLLVLMRAAQLGFFSHNRIKELASDRDGSYEISHKEWGILDVRVCAELGQFARAVF